MAAKKEDEQKKKSEAALVMEWWAGLDKNRGGRAELRRAKDLEQVYFSPAFHSLYKKLGATKWRSREQVALLAGVLAQVSSHAGTRKFAVQMASPGKSGSKARVSGLRFRRLLQNKTAPDIYGPLIRVIRLLDKKANIADLAASLYWWNDRTRQSWAFDYYKTAPGET